VLLRVIRALDPRFDPLILQLEIGDLATNYTVVVSKLTEFERRIGPREATKEGAFSTTNTKSKTKFQRKCYNCEKTEHIARDCRAPKRDSRKPGNNSSTEPLPTPSGSRGLSLAPSKATGTITTAKYAVEQS
jgi:hypothetical protein